MASRVLSWEFEQGSKEEVAVRRQLKHQDLEVEKGLE